MKTLHLRPAGLWTDPSPYSDAPEGALLDAKNVWIRRMGIIEPRPGFANAISGITPPANHIPYRLVPFGGDVIAFSEQTGFVTAWKTIWLSDGDEITGYTGPESSGVTIKTAEARGSLYVANSAGMLKLTSGTDTAWEDVGSYRLPTPYSSNAYTGGDAWLEPSQYVAYRVVLVREDANGYIRRSPPSERAILQNTTASAIGLVVSVILHDEVAAGDIIELYRTLSSTVDDPGDEMQLAVSHVVTSAQVAAGAAHINDGTAEDALGASLYTNETQQGIAQANDPPPVAECMAYFAGSMFYGNVRLATKTVVLELMQPLGATGTGWGSVTAIAGDLNNASDTITNVSATDIAQVHVGMRIRDSTTAEYGVAGTYIPANTVIDAINAGAGTIQMSNAATGTAVGEELTAGDTMDVNGVEFAAGMQNDTTLTPPEFDASNDEDAFTKASNFALVFNALATGLVCHVGTDTGTGRAYLYFERTPGTAMFDQIAIVSSGSRYWAPNIEEDWNAESYPARLYWSKTDEPEAVPGLNFATIGQESKAILALVTIRDALLIFKEDGIWRLTGSDPSTFRIDLLDPTTYLIHPDAACAMEGRCIAWTNKGVVAVSDTGMTPLSDPAIQDQLQSIQNTVLFRAGAADGVWATAWEEENTFLLGVPSSASDKVATVKVWCLNTKTGTWTYWDRAWFHAVANPDDGTLWAARSDSTNYRVSQSRSPIATYAAADTETGATIAFESIVAWVAKTAGDATAQHWFAEMTALFEEAAISSLVVSFTSDWSSTAATVTPTLSTSRPRPLRIVVPREHARASILYPKLTITANTAVVDGGTYRWELAGIALQIPSSTQKARHA